MALPFPKKEKEIHKLELIWYAKFFDFWGWNYLAFSEAEESIILEDEEDEYLASAVNEYMQLNDRKVCDVEWLNMCG